MKRGGIVGAIFWMYKVDKKYATFRGVDGSSPEHCSRFNRWTEETPCKCTSITHRRRVDFKQARKKKRMLKSA